jgi:hypothetical protein
VTEAEPTEATRPPAPLSDLFATAVHRFGRAWADLVVSTVIALAAGSVPLLVAASLGAGATPRFIIGAMSYGVAYFGLLAHVVLHGLPAPPPRSRWVAAFLTAVPVGLLAAVVVLQLLWFAVVALPLLLFAVPSVAAGDQAPLRAVPRGAMLAIRTFNRTWGVWLITVLFSGPVVVAMFLIVSAFAGTVTASLIALAMAAPIVWPFSALFIRALYGDLTGRLVVAPQDRTR